MDNNLLQPEQIIMHRWINAGFSPQEAHEFTYGHGDVNVDAQKVYDSQPAIQARHERLRWIKFLRQNNWTDQQIKQAIRNHYSPGKNNSPWDFIRENYRSLGTKPMPQYREAAALRARERTNQLYALGRKHR